MMSGKQLKCTARQARTTADSLHDAAASMSLQALIFTMLMLVMLIACTFGAGWSGLQAAHVMSSSLCADVSFPVSSCQVDSWRFACAGAQIHADTGQAGRVHV